MSGGIKQEKKRMIFWKCGKKGVRVRVRVISQRRHLDAHQPSADTRLQIMIFLDVAKRGLCDIWEKWVFEWGNDTREKKRKIFLRCGKKGGVRIWEKGLSA